MMTTREIRRKRNAEYKRQNRVEVVYKEAPSFAYYEKLVYCERFSTIKTSSFEAIFEAYHDYRNSQQWE